MAIKICVLQLNFVVGDLQGNARKIIAAANSAYEDGARLVLTPELAICGYAAEDLFLRDSFTEACLETVHQVAQALSDLPGLALVLGHPLGGHARTRSVATSYRYNALSVWREGRQVAVYAKRELPNYQVFDERRYFRPGEQVCVFEAGTGAQRVRVGLLICEDAWFDQPARETLNAGAELLLVANASPFHLGKGLEREEMMRRRTRDCGLPMIYAHLVGGQDEVIFEGHSFALQADGTLAGRAGSFVEECPMFELFRPATGVWSLRASIAPEREALADLWDALVLGVRDYVNKNGFPGVIIGLSGGVDSALVLAVAVDALGPSRVRCVMMPSPYTADISRIDAQEMASRMGVQYDVISIVPEFDAFLGSLAPHFGNRPADATEENIQARIRGTLLMALSNKSGSIVLTTGNKSEMATGYCTLYGDMAGGFAVIKDLTKTRVFSLANWRNDHNPYQTCEAPIPQRIISRPPSAELRPDQTDQDSLPPYDVLDAILCHYMEEDQSMDEIVAAGYEPEVVGKVIRLIKLNEYKRRQSPVGIRVTHRGFGKDWRYPITNRFNG
ncbi:MAG: NAD+ synthase [Rhodoferax sp.]|nr:NAD+ synthase [Rhodoferax sp.]